MTISVPLTSSATKHNAVIQCVTRTVALWRGALAGAVTEPTRLRSQAVPAIGRILAPERNTRPATGPDEVFAEYRS